MAETWPDYEVKVLDEARIVETKTGQVVWEPADHVAVIRIRTKLEAIIPVPVKLVGLDADLNRLRPYVVDELRRKINAEPRSLMTTDPDPTTEPDQPDVEPAPEPDEEPSDPHAAPLDDDDDARNLDPVDPRRREAEQRRGRSFDADDDDTTDEQPDT